MVEVEKPDLSFTKDPSWISQREVLWENVYVKYYNEARASRLKALKEYFFSGEFSNPVGSGLGSSTFLRARIDGYPLRKAEGWDYVVYEYGGYSEEELEDVVSNAVLSGLKHRGWSKTEELALWDYFLGETYNFELKSPGPTKRQGACIYGELPISMVVTHFVSGLSSLLKGNLEASPKYLYKAEYLISALGEIDAKVISEDVVLNRKLNALFDRVHRSRDKVISEYRDDMDQFVESVTIGVDSVVSESKVKDIWAKWS